MECADLHPIGAYTVRLERHELQKTQHQGFHPRRTVSWHSALRNKSCILGNSRPANRPCLQTDKHGPNRTSGEQIRVAAHATRAVPDRRSGPDVFLRNLQDGSLIDADGNSGKPLTHPATATLLIYGGCIAGCIVVFTIGKAGAYTFLIAPCAQIVPQASASIPGSPSVPLNKNHRELVRFSSRDDADYLAVLVRLKSMILSPYIAGRTPQSETLPPTGIVVHLFSPPIGQVLTAVVVAEPAVMKLPFSLPVPQNGKFVGRDKQLKRLHDHLSRTTEAENSPDNQSRVAVVHGLGGAGKTHLSVAYASTHRKDFDAVLWVDGTDRISTYTSYQSIGHRLLDAFAQTGRDYTHLGSKLAIGESSSDREVPTDREALPKIAQAVVEFLQSETESFSWLLIVDNVDNLTDYPLSSFLPQSKRGSIIITTRLTTVTKFGQAVEVGQIENESAVQILVNAAPLRRKTASGLYPQVADIVRCKVSLIIPP